MRTKLLSVMLVLGLVAVGFSVFGLGLVSAGTVHVVDGEVGPLNTAGPTNPANDVFAAFYLLNKPAEPIQTQASIPPASQADGTAYASYGADVGSPWNWAVGDTVVVVVEAVAGTNGWTGANQTSSSDGPLSTFNIDSLPRANLEPIPALTLVRASTYVDVRWTSLTDANGNVKNYTVSRGVDGGVPTAIGRSGQATPAAAMNYNDTTVAVGHRYCYNIRVNYQKDTGTAVYTTTGTSDWACAVIATAPTILTTTPTNGQIDVPVTTDISVTFSLRMDPTTVTYSITPNIGVTSAWDAPVTTLTLSHAAPFAQCTQYTVRIITGEDAVNHMPLAAGPVPNPWTFIAFCPSAQISSTSPADRERGVGLNQPIVVTFTKAMTTANVNIAINPSPGGIVMNWNTPTNTIMTVTHNAFALNTNYNVTVTDATLQPGPVPNPWQFWSNAAPTGAVTAPTAASDWTGGSTQTIAWTMTDDVAISVDVWINYTSATAGNGVVVGRTHYTASPATYAWPAVPSVNAADVAVTIDVVDAAGGKVTLTSPQFKIDSTAPTASTVPASGATNVGLTDNVVITFSEAMTTAPTEGAVAITGGSGLTYAWSAGNTILTVGHAPYAPRTSYTLTIAAGAVDASSPGNAISPMSVPFTTGAPRPSAPVLAAPTNVQAAQMDLSWTAPTTFEGLPGWVLLAGNITGYLVFWAPTATAAETSWTNITPSGGITGRTFTATGLAASTQYCFFVKAVTTNGLSAPSTGQCATTGAAQVSDLTWLWILLIIIIVVVVIALILWSRRKKPEAMAPEAAPEAPAEPAPEAAPVEEPTPPEEPTTGGETGGQPGGEGGNPPA